MYKTHKEQFEKVQKITCRPQSTWTLNEESVVYWWFLHEMETPTEDWLKYNVKRYFEDRTRWCTFLLQCFPTETNMEFVRRMLDHGAYGQYRFVKVIKGIFNAKPLSFSHIDLVQKYLAQRPKKTSGGLRDKIRRIMTRHYDI